VECKVNETNSNESKRIYAIDYLRAFNILGTVVFHSCLAYSPAIQERLSSGLKAQMPLIDYTTQFPFMDILLVVRSTYSMQLMFLISGLFSWSSLSKRGEFRYVIERLKRLALPFLVGILAIIPLAYYPRTLLEGEYDPTLLEFFKSYLWHGPYQGLHLWFLWLLVAFDFIIAFAHFSLRPFHIKRLSVKLGLLLVGLTLVIGMLMNQRLAQSFGPYNWVHIYGPFDMQLDSLPLYLSHFICGCLLGNIGLDKVIQFFNPNRYKVIVSLLIISALDLALNAMYLHGCLQSDGSFDQNLNLIFNSITMLSIVLLLIVFYSLFSTGNPILNNLQASSFSIYIVHYTVVAWLQFAMISYDVPSIDKPLLVVLFAIPICWLSANLWNRLIAKLRNSFSAIILPI